MNEGNCFYFTTNTSSMWAQQFMKNPKASIYAYFARWKFLSKYGSHFVYI